MSYAEIKALCAGNPLKAEKMNLGVEVAKLRLLKADYQIQHYCLEDDLLKHFPERIVGVTERIAGIEKDIAAYTVENEKLIQIQTGMFCADEPRALFRFFQAHVEKPVAAKDSIIKFHIRECFHLVSLGRIASCVNFTPLSVMVYY